ncbi:hypothetical protein METUNv1_01423 [Methyloversatilis universalis FAM5]|uniref:Uncharacterized protein n=1 Tax=Methyloversatilis universalis (strain ATCC BAA-1314 / DSM 25237 / JCM 13912 / CCUG 52030 / FAM5) TaxID=1000565 RepID=F5RAT6_METUF|nr:hypothetical protein METUNv1_01423 [Methyloversatilis universalis FAM5]
MRQTVPLRHRFRARLSRGTSILSGGAGPRSCSTPHNFRLNARLRGEGMQGLSPEVRHVLPSPAVRQRTVRAVRRPFLHRPRRQRALGYFARRL